MNELTYRRVSRSDKWAMYCKAQEEIAKQQAEIDARNKILIEIEAGYLTGRGRSLFIGRIRQLTNTEPPRTEIHRSK